jgi:LysM repeat protein
MNKLIIILLILFFTPEAWAQRMTVEEYIEQFKDIAMSEMKRSGVPAAITLAQGILESENGNGDLVKRSNNHFGIKCKSTWAGESVNHDDDAEGECFRAYTNAEESYRDHSDFLRANKRYASLFSLDAADYKGWARGLKRAGYATNPRYPELLIKQVEQYNLQQYTLLASGNSSASGIFDDKGLTTPAEVPVVQNEANPVQNVYPTSINKTKCVFAKKGSSLLALATEYNINLHKLMEFNDLTEDGILGKDQYIYLQKKQKTGGKEYHVVQPRETLYDVAQINGIQLQYLKQYNELSDDRLPDENIKLFLQPGLKEKVDTKTKVHRVERREGLYAIARKYNVTVQQLREWNNLESTDLRIGQEIIVSK